MAIEQLMTAAKAPLAVAVGLNVTGTRTVAFLALGIAVLLALSVWRRRRETGRDPLRSLAPPAGPLRLARKLTMRSTTD